MKTIFPLNLERKMIVLEKSYLKKVNLFLSDAELIAILIGSGSQEESAVELSKRILIQAKNNLNELSKMSVPYLIRFKGIGEAKALSVVAALELRRRRKDQPILLKPKITSSRDAYVLMRDVLDDLPHEEFWVLLLNRANKVLARNCISKGGFTGTIADPKVIFKVALEQNACGIILLHNHPSGNLNPSQSDKKITQQFKQSGSFLEIPILDHLIAGENNYFSFADEGLL